MNAVQLPSSGYYLITISPMIGRYLLRSNSERAFVISILQTVLRKRSLIDEPSVRTRLATHIDLLAYSVQSKAILLLVFAIAKTAARSLSECISEALQQYQSEWHYGNTDSFSSHAVTITSLPGPHAALNESVALHLLHTDWEYDRYSSIGFYLHDRRGDWMSLWRMAQLYEYDPILYRKLITEATTMRPYRAATKQPSAPLLHG